MTITICPSCGSGKIKRVNRDWSSDAGGSPYTVKALAFYECPDCGERVFGRDAMHRIEMASPVYRHSRKIARPV